MKTEESTEDEKPKEINSYKIGELLYTYRNYNVYIGLNSSTNEEVTIKIINKKYINGNPQASIFLNNDILFSRLLVHKNILKLLDTYETPKYVFIIMENFKGELLSSYMKKHKKLDEKKALELFTKIIDGMAFMHDLNICHLNLNLDSILINEKDENLIKIFDFKYGEYYYAKFKTLNKNVGSNMFTCPEVSNLDNYYPESADVWSCGIILCYLLTGKYPIDSNKGINDKDRYIIPKGINNDLIDLIKNMLNIDVDKRYVFNDIINSKYFVNNNYNTVLLEKKNYELDAMKIKNIYENFLQTIHPQAVVNFDSLINNKEELPNNQIMNKDNKLFNSMDMKNIDNNSNNNYYDNYISLYKTYYQIENENENEKGSSKTFNDINGKEKKNDILKENPFKKIKSNNNKKQNIKRDNIGEKYLTKKSSNEKSSKIKKNKCFNKSIDHKSEIHPSLNEKKYVKNNNSSIISQKRNYKTISQKGEEKMNKTIKKENLNSNNHSNKSNIFVNKSINIKKCNTKNIEDNKKFNLNFNKNKKGKEKNVNRSYEKPRLNLKNNNNNKNKNITKDTHQSIDSKNLSHIIRKTENESNNNRKENNFKGSKNKIFEKKISLNKAKLQKHNISNMKIETEKNDSFKNDNNNYNNNYNSTIDKKRSSDDINKREKKKDLNKSLSINVDRIVNNINTKSLTKEKNKTPCTTKRNKVYKEKNKTPNFGINYNSKKVGEIKEGSFCYSYNYSNNNKGSNMIESNEETQNESDKQQMFQIINYIQKQNDKKACKIKGEKIKIKKFLNKTQNGSKSDVFRTNTISTTNTTKIPLNKKNSFKGNKSNLPLLSKNKKDNIKKSNSYFDYGTDNVHKSQKCINSYESILQNLKEMNNSIEGKKENNAFRNYMRRKITCDINFPKRKNIIDFDNSEKSYKSSKDSYKSEIDSDNDNEITTFTNVKTRKGKYNINEYVKNKVMNRMKLRNARSIEFNNISDNNLLKTRNNKNNNQRNNIDSLHSFINDFKINKYLLNKSINLNEEKELSSNTINKAHLLKAKNNLKKKLIDESLCLSEKKVKFYDKSVIDIKYISLKNYEQTVNILKNELTKKGVDYTKIDYNSYKCVKGMRQFFVDIVKIPKNLYYYKFFNKNK